jgi:hypothetical protein
MQDSADAAWASVTSLDVGGRPARQTAPDRIVTVADAGAPILRVDVWIDYPAALHAQDAIIWHGTLCIGFGDDVHLVSLTDRSVVTIPLHGYFDGLHPSDEFLLIASQDRVFRIAPDRALTWTSDFVAVDGVIISDIEPDRITGSGEWDPPGGWRDFVLDTTTGAVQ